MHKTHHFDIKNPKKSKIFWGGSHLKKFLATPLHEAIDYVLELSLKSSVLHSN